MILDSHIPSLHINVCFYFAASQPMDHTKLYHKFEAFHKVNLEYLLELNYLKSLMQVL